MIKVGVVGIVLALLLGGCAATTEMATKSVPAGPERGPLPVAVTGVEGMEKGLFRDGRVYVGGQPSPESLASLVKMGVAAVVNLRTPNEMADKTQVSFDEGAEVKNLGMEYVSIPVGGSDYPYGPQAVEKFAKVLDKVRGPVLLHCRTGVRASYVWTAYLVRYGGLDLDEALAHGRAMAIPADPLGQLLGRQLKLVWAVPQSPAPSPAPVPR